MTSAITTHVLDTALGRPAAGVPVTLSVATADTWRPLAEAITDADGRVTTLGPARIAAGRYRITLDTESYFATTGQEAFFPEVVVTFVVADPDRHYHVPVLLSPFAVCTYRGS